MFSQSKWNRSSQNNQESCFEENQIPADAISADLKTSHNTLSFWKCDGITEEYSKSIDDVFLALISGRRNLAKIELVFVELQVLEGDEQKISQTTGKTCVNGLEDLHFDIKDLDFVALGQVAARILEAKNNKQTKRLTRKKVIALLLEAIEGGRVDIELLDENLQRQINEEIAKAPKLKDKYQG